MLLFFSVSLVFVAIVFGLARLKLSPCHSLCIAMASGFLIPSFWIVWILGEPISVQTGAAVVSLVLFLASGGSLRLSFTIGDIAIGFIFLVHCVSDGVLHHQGWSSILVAYGEWMLPYAAGRYAFGSRDSFCHSRWILAAFLLVAFLVWQGDLLLNVNFIHSFSQAFSDWEPTRAAARFSWTRSAGLTEHPIFFSGLLMAICPVVVLAWWNREWVDLIKWYFLVTVVLGLVCITLSRAAVVAIAITSLCMVVFCYPRSRLPLLVSVGGLLLIVFLVPQWAEETWMKTGEGTDMRRRIVTINGESKLHSSTLARVRAFDVYGRSALRAGLFGYGTAAVREFPPNVPFLPQETAAIDTVWTVENAYLLIVLRFGWLGLIALSFLALAPLVQVFFTRSPDIRRERAIFAAGLTSVAILLVTVHSSYQIMFSYLWVMGLFNGLVDPRIGR